MVYTGPQVLSWHEAVDWSRVAGAGHTLAWCPATAGIATVDERFRSNWAAMADVGLVRGAVHVLSPSYVGRGEARHFVSVIGDPTGALTALAVQPDGHRETDRLPALDQVADFAGEFARLTGGHPLIIRTKWSWWAHRDPHGAGHRISPYLWHADGSWAYRSSRLGRPAFSTYGGWATPTIWSAHRMSCPGIAGLCGITMFTGDLRALTALLGLADVDVDEPQRRAGPLQRLRRAFRLGRPA